MVEAKDGDVLWVNRLGRAYNFTKLCKRTNLDLEGSGICDEGCRHLAAALQSDACKVAVLELGHNEIGHEGCQHLAAALQSDACKVTTLELRHNEIGDKGCRRLAAALQSYACKVATLDLGHNEIGDEGCRHLASALQSKACKVTTLYLGHNEIGDKGCRRLAAALQSKACKVTTLDLCFIWISTKGCRHLAAALQNRVCEVTTLNLRGNYIGIDGCRHLAKMLESAACKITTLNLKNNFDLGDQGLLCLLSAQLRRQRLIQVYHRLLERIFITHRHLLGRVRAFIGIPMPGVQTCLSIDVTYTGITRVPRSLAFLPGVTLHGLTTRNSISYPAGLSYSCNPTASAHRLLLAAFVKSRRVRASVSTEKVGQHDGAAARKRTRKE